MKLLQPVNLSAEQYWLGCQVMASLPFPVREALRREREDTELGTHLQDVLYVELEETIYAYT